MLNPINRDNDQFADFGIRQQISYERQAAIKLKSAIGTLTIDETYNFELIPPALKTINSPVTKNYGVFQMR